jgi:hypothetical protein
MSVTGIGHDISGAIAQPKSSAHLPPHRIEIEPDGRALVALAQQRRDIICLGARLAVTSWRRYSIWPGAATRHLS